MRYRTRRTLVGVALLCLLAVPALASDLDAAKTAGWVGERVDGYVGMVKSGAPADVRALVDRVNAGRKESYQEIAQKHGISVDAVAARAGQKLVAGTPSGGWVFTSSGRWEKKP